MKRIFLPLSLIFLCNYTWCMQQANTLSTAASVATSASSWNLSGFFEYVQSGLRYQETNSTEGMVLIAGAGAQTTRYQNDTGRQAQEKANNKEIHNKFSSFCQDAGGIAKGTKGLPTDIDTIVRQSGKRYCSVIFALRKLVTKGGEELVPLNDQSRLEGAKSITNEHWQLSTSPLQSLLSIIQASEDGLGKHEKCEEHRALEYLVPLMEALLNPETRSAKLAELEGAYEEEEEEDQ